MKEITPPLAGRREWIGLAVLALPCMLYAMDLTVLNLAVPTLSADLRPTSAQLLWIVDIYGFMVAGMLITMGTLGDRIGRRRVLLWGAAAFGSASLLAAFSRSAEMLIVARAILGIAGATLAPSTLSLIRNMFADSKQRSVAISVWITSYSVGGAIGPPVGGLLLDHFWWGSAFLIGVPIMALLLVAGPILLPEFRDPNAGRIDLLSALMSLSAVLLVIYGIKQFAAGTGGWGPTVSIVYGVAIGVGFMRRQRTLANPLVDVRLFRARAFTMALIAYSVATAVAFGLLFFEGQYLQLVFGLSAVEASLAMLPIFLSFIVGAWAAPLIARRFQPEAVMIAGLVTAAGGFIVVGLVSPSSGVVFLMTGCVIYCLSIAPVVTLATDLMVSAAPAERVGAASALSETASELGGALGIAVLGSIGTAVYRSTMLNMVPSTVPVAASETARNTLGGALDVARQLSAHDRGALITAARSAFSHSMNTVSFISALAVLSTAIVLFIIHIQQTRERSCKSRIQSPSSLAATAESAAHS
jgi:MFS transporter, DHA2 family, multidrug resistance protein